MKANKILLGLLGLVMLVTAVVPVGLADVVAGTLDKTYYEVTNSDTATIDFAVDFNENTAQAVKLLLEIDGVIVGANIANVQDGSVHENKVFATIGVNEIASKVTSIGVDSDGKANTGAYTKTLNLIADTNGDGKKDAGELPVLTSPITINIKAADDAGILHDDDLISKIDLEENEVAPGDSFDVEIELRTDKGESHENVKITAWIGNLDGTKEESREFNIGKVHDDDEKTKTLTLTVPEDADQNDYKVYVEVRSQEIGGGLLDTAEEDLTVERKDDNLKILGFDENKVRSAKAGSSLNLQIELLNNGLDDQNDVEVTAEIVGTDAKVTGNLDIIQQDMTRIWSGVLKVPATLADGRYTLAITAKSAEGATEMVSQELSVTSGEAAEAGDATLDAEGSTSKDLGAAGAVFQATLENTGDATAKFEIELSGDDWVKSSDISPDTELTLDAGKTKTVNVFVVPKDGETGDKTFTLYVKSDGKVVDSVTYTAKLGGSAAGFTGLSNLVVEGLQWLFAVLVVVAVVLFILWLGKKGSKKNGEDDKVYY